MNAQIKYVLEVSQGAGGVCGALVNIRRLGSCVVGALLGLWASGAQAVPMVFTSSAEFQAALPGAAQVQDFEGFASGTRIAEGEAVDGIAITTNLDGFPLEITAAPPHGQSLGVGDRVLNGFLSGEELEFSFASPLQAFGLLLTASATQVLANDFLLVAGESLVFNDGTPDSVSDSGESFFLGIIDAAGFGTASLLSFGDPAQPFFQFTVDDITTVASVPEPGSLALFGLGLLALFGSRKSLSRARAA